MDLVRYESSGGISSITLDDGKANVLSPQMFRALNEALGRAEAENNVVLLTGKQGVFSGGFDLTVFKQSRADQFEMLRAGALLTERLRSFPAPIVTACSGHAIAMGVFTMLSTDVRIGVDGAFKIWVNEVHIGMTVPRFAIETCRQRLAPTRFHRAVITGELHTPQQALDAGFFDHLVPASELLSTAKRQAVALAAVGRNDYVATKRRAQESQLRTLRDAIERDLEDWKSSFGQDSGEK